MDLNLKNSSLIYNQNVEFSEKQKTETDLWNNIIYPEFNNIYAQIKKPKKDKQIDETLETAKTANKAGMIWNKKFEHYRFYKNHIYYIELISDLSMPSLLFKKWTVENFCKEVCRLECESEKNTRKKEIISKVFSVSILILWIILVVYLIRK